jgi:hypothetical protein
MGKMLALLIVFLFGKSFPQDSSEPEGSPCSIHGNPEFDCNFGVAGMCENKDGKCVETENVCEIENGVISHLKDVSPEDEANYTRYCEAYLSCEYKGSACVAKGGDSKPDDSEDEPEDNTLVIIIVVVAAVVVVAVVVIVIVIVIYRKKKNKGQQVERLEATCLIFWFVLIYII